MKTDDLISMLGANVERVDRRQFVRTLSSAVVVGAIVALGAMLFTFGIRADLDEAGALTSLFLKLAFTMGILVPASIYLIRLSRPGGERKTSIALMVLPFIAIMLLAAISLSSAPSSHWNKMITGDQWLECLLSIPTIAIVPFAVIIWAVRRTAPTDLVRTGALVGLIAGAVSATGYALHCMDDSLPFVALWYGGTIALCSFAGAKLGPWLLRW
ncbi:NrsF family protein [Roseixanthobacter liquoris]|uniref:NrsF family protein n=1 Tax=Roseixanthobacter liquoris TaxID=3119921 RepID=UPI00372B446E